MTISLLDQAAEMQFEDYNPAGVINAVNTLLPLGKEGALERVAACIERHGKGEEPCGLYWVLRVLFDLPGERGFPPVRMGRPSIPPPSAAGALPRFPIVLVWDVPLLVIRGYDLNGLPEPVAVHAAYFQAHGVLREQPLRPPASTHGMKEEFLHLWKAAYGNAYVMQALETIDVQLKRYAEKT